MTTPNTPQSTKKKIEEIIGKHWCMVTGQRPIYEHMTSEEATQALLTILKETCEEVLPEKLDPDGRLVTVPTGQTVQDKDLANWNRGHNNCIDQIKANITRLTRSGKFHLKKDEAETLCGLLLVDDDIEVTELPSDSDCNGCVTRATTQNHNKSKLIGEDNG